MATFQIRKVNSLPGTLEAHTLYITKDGSNAVIYVTNAAGTTAMPLKAVAATPTIDAVLDAGNTTTKTMQAAGFYSRPSGNDAAYVDNDGVFSNISNTSFFPGSSGIGNNASVVGLLTKRNTDSGGMSAAVVGLDQTTSGASQSWGGYFTSILSTTKAVFDGSLESVVRSKMNGLVINAVRTSGSMTITKSEFFVCCVNSSTISVGLPNGVNLETGRMVFIQRASSGGVSVDGGSQSINGGGTTLGLDSSGVYLFIYEGVTWRAFHL